MLKNLALSIFFEVLIIKQFDEMNAVLEECEKALPSHVQ